MCPHDQGRCDEVTEKGATRDHKCNQRCAAVWWCNRHNTWVTDHWESERRSCLGEESDCHVVIVGSDSDGSADVSEMIHEDVKHFAIHTPSEPEMDELTKKTRGAWRIIGFGAYKGRTMPRYSDNSKRDWGDRSNSRQCR